MKQNNPNHLIEFIKKNKSQLLNIYIAVNFLIFAVRKLYTDFSDGTMDFTLVSFTIQSTALIIYILIRKQHKIIDSNYFHQLIALTAFFSGMVFILLPQTGGENEKLASNIIIFISNVLGVLTIINLGKSFGILIAVREVKTGGLYSIVRHPMYGTDILLRIGFVISHFTWMSVLLMIISISCYLYRAILEERLLSTQDEYKQYMKKVKYRLIPYIF